MWDEIWLVFKGGIFWQQMVQQWSKVVDNVTRALILNLFAIDIHESSEEGSSVDGRGKRLASNRSDKSSDNGSVNGGGMYGNSDEETAIEPNSDKDIQSVVQVGLLNPSNPLISYISFSRRETQPIGFEFGCEL